ncbi:MAG: tetratricopeptide repeat protein [Oscillospiraceae bacterium]|nr:tetratricopeptide repeat protein [Oscillospiraceae bacterium]
MKKNIVRAVLIILIIAIIGFYVYDLVVNHSAPIKNLFRTLSIVFLCLAGLVRTFSGGSRRSLDSYAALYPDILEHAFETQPFWQKKLLCAVRLYNEDNLDKSLRYLMDLKKRCQTKEDHYAVNIFVALCFTDAELYQQAEKVYMQLVNMGIANSRIFSNLGHVQIKAGEYHKALQNYKLALEFDRDNAFAYNNIAQAHFQMHEFEQAISYAQKALEIKPKLHQASTLLAIIYTLMEDKDNSEKYFHIAISSGRDPADLKETIEYYRSAQHTLDDVSTE